MDPSKRLTLDQIMCHPFINSNKIPKSLPASCLQTVLPKSFVEQFTYYGGSLGVGKIHNSMNALEKVENDYEKNKLQKGISERILCTSHLYLFSKIFGWIQQEPLFEAQRGLPKWVSSKTNFIKQLFYKARNP